ncbi:hypothetical protein JAAARDRAFT_189265 [Jaapia argillacea MUCL 33604]|uniref:t-SNARE coiled-coil homology domain-containing protein n=1 Tax=Jaapia argillacea MUCL 33604 TaxID=933084 RepID=A0A067Q9J3_9AGAM|nr:hypothetical protein JAAARDRAFT_189265 [Jaapia argillacea MUCL 33604]
MSFFKRKDKNMIPPVQSEQAARDALLGSRSNVPPSQYPPSYRSNASTYVASRDGDPYSAPPMARSGSGSQPSPGGAADPTPRYSRNTGVGDSYTRGEGNLDKDRQELFSGYNPEKAGSGRFFNKGANDGPAGEDEDEETEGIKQQLRYTKQESVNSTRNALRMAREAEETARNTITKLGDQSEKLANTERHLDVSKSHTLRAEDKTDELKKLNRSIFRPAITFNKDSKRAAQEAKIQQRYEDERDERERAMMDIRETQNRLGQASTYGQQDLGDQEAIGGPGGGGVGRGRFKTADQQAERKEQRKRFQFEATASDDEAEDELDDNLDEIHDVSKRLKALGMAMGGELDNQIGRIGRIEDKTVSLDNKVFRNTERLKQIK